MTPYKGRLPAIQALRAIAAIAVVMHHAAGQVIVKEGVAPLFSLFEIGDHGVELFFAISGFIIIYAHANDSYGFLPAYRYIWKRLLRILPSTILVATAWLFTTKVAAVVGFPAPQIDFSTWISSAFVLPMLDSPSPVVIWTLRNEFVFYGVFLLFFLSRPLFFVALAAWGIICLVTPTQVELYELDSNIFALTLLTALNAIFCLGVLSYCLYRKASIARPHFLFWPMLVTFCAISWADHAITPVPALIFGLIAAPLVYAAAQIRAEGTFVRIVENVGDASYAIYLIHLPMIAITYPLLSKLTNNLNLIYAVEVSMSMWGGWLFFFYFEKPLAGVVRQLTFFDKSRMANA